MVYPKLIAIASGKGGVGKSTVAVNLAYALKRRGVRVGIVDADIYGPSIPRMLGGDGDLRPLALCPGQPGFLRPAMAHGIAYISVALLSRPDLGGGRVSMVRAPVATSLVRSFIQEVVWECDLLLVDFPPGTGDIQIALLQSFLFSGALLVSTPQQVALEDVDKAAQMFCALELPILGLVENMASYQGSRLFGDEGALLDLAKRYRTSRLASLPLDPEISRSADAGLPLHRWRPSSETSAILEPVAEALLVSAEADALPRVELLEQGSELMLFWEGGEISRYSVRRLQENCPCIVCQEKRGRGNLAIVSDLMALSWERVGRYGISLEFSSGCSKGTYSYSLLQHSSFSSASF